MIPFTLKRLHSLKMASKMTTHITTAEHRAAAPSYAHTIKQWSLCTANRFILQETYEYQKVSRRTAEGSDWDPPSCRPRRCRYSAGCSAALGAEPWGSGPSGSSLSLACPPSSPPERRARDTRGTDVSWTWFTSELEAVWLVRLQPTLWRVIVLQEICLFAIFCLSILLIMLLVGLVLLLMHLRKNHNGVF